MSSDPIKQLLDALAGSLTNEGTLTDGQDITVLRAKLAELPTETSDEGTLFAFCLEHLRKASKGVYNEGRKRELELEIRMLSKPDDVDLGSEENQHITRYLEAEQLSAELSKRKGTALLRFCDVIESKFEVSNVKKSPSKSETPSPNSELSPREEWARDKARGTLDH